uniref:uncharacterized protein LOC117609718 n=1 Tax=Osmia lignaria TaxID=473952 RepID=UPI0014789AD6|nr:uncharacterized protein LOC117609718 [Osmia lignaria]
MAKASSWLSVFRKVFHAESSCSGAAHPKGSKRLATSERIRLLVYRVGSLRGGRTRKEKVSVVGLQTTPKSCFLVIGSGKDVIHIRMPTNCDRSQRETLLLVCSKLDQHPQRKERRTGCAIGDSL